MGAGRFPVSLQDECVRHHFRTATSGRSLPPVGLSVILFTPWQYPPRKP